MLRRYITTAIPYVNSKPHLGFAMELVQTAGDLYQKYYEGLYCVGCEQFYSDAELVNGLCPEHLTPPQLVSEENSRWLPSESPPSSGMDKANSTSQPHYSPE